EARAAHQTPPDRRTAAQKELVAKTNRLLVVSPKQVVSALSDADWAKHRQLTRQLKSFDSRKPAPLPVAMGLQDAAGPPPKTFLLGRGGRDSGGGEVRPGSRVTLPPGHKPAPAPVEPPRPTTTGRRSALANWVARPDNPLTARVLVNRLWQHHFGRG